jgi:hypothetical protein
MRRYTPLTEFDAKLVERQIAVLDKALAYPLMMIRKLAAAGRPSLLLGLERSGLAMQDHQIVHASWRYPEMAGCLAVGMAFQNKRHNSLTQRHRMWFAHARAPRLSPRRITYRLIWES